MSASTRRIDTVISPVARVRREAALEFLSGLAPAADAIIVGTSRAAADELAADLAVKKGGLFGVTRAGYIELATRCALASLSRAGLSPTGALSTAAIAARAAFQAADSGALRYFAPVASLPGFPRALARTVAELRLAGVRPEQLGALDGAGHDLAELLERVEQEASKASAVDRARLLDFAARAIREDATHLSNATLVLLDLSVATAADRAFVSALAGAAGAVLMTIPSGDDRTFAAVADLFPQPVTPPTSNHRSALARLQQQLFLPEIESSGVPDASVQLFSAPGEGRECVEIARRVMEEAARGVPFDEMAVLVRAPQTYLGLLEHAFTRAGIRAWFDRGTRRPDPSGRAFLSLLACADEELSARRFAEYLSLGQVPSDDAEDSHAWPPPVDEVVESLVPPTERIDEADPEEEARAAAQEPERRGVVAGTLRAPWRWEDLLVESAVIRRLDRWKRRLAGLRVEYQRKRDELASDEPESPRIAAIERDLDHLDHLTRFALPIVTEMCEWRSTPQRWGAWLGALQQFAPRVLRQPARVLRVLQELAPLADIGPVSLREVREVLTPRLLTLTHEPPRRRHGRVFVGTPHAARGRAFRVVFVPGLAERVFPQRLREDALLLDDRRRTLAAQLVTQDERRDDERLHLRLAVGTAMERIYLSWPRIELQESRPRVPSFYVLDVARAVEGHIPAYATLRDRAFAAGGATLAWPAPANPDRAIDEFEHDLSMLFQLLREPDRVAAKGRARYLYELSPHLQRSLTSRWARWQRRWHAADGLIDSTPAIAPALAQQRLGTRPFSLSALQRYAECPYQFLLSAIYRLAPLEEPAPLQRLDPLTRGSLFHSIQTEFLRELEKNGLLPLNERRLPTARRMLDWAIGSVSKDAYDKLAPAIDRVWHDEMASIARDLRGWLEQLVDDGREWCPERFEFAFGLPGDPGRDPRSVVTPAKVDDRFLIRGSIDLVERRIDGRTLRVTDHKTGRNRTTLATMVDGGRVLQPLLYGMALEAITGDQVESGRLSFCTSLGGFTVRDMPLNELSRPRALEVLEVIDRGIEHGWMAARPAEGACRRCDFMPVCGAEEERRTAKKVGTLFDDLDALRRLP